jgi:dihydrosphingosine 1-phosphate phosphatase
VSGKRRQWLTKGHYLRLVHLLASGVFFTGFIKDMCSLPRPLSPPLQRITMSGSAALEYGFPSTHSANAVSVTVYVLLALNSPDSTLSPTAKLVFTVLAWWYAISIVFGRLYCGMHGFLDVIFGSLFGALLAYIEFYGGPVLQTWMLASNWTAPALVALVVIVLVRVHPEPVDDCPCFDDSVAFAGVVMGLEAGSWRMAQSSLGPWYAGGAFSLSQLGWSAVVARILLGVVAIFAWREVMKPSLLKTLPHLFRVIEKAGMSLPRRFFMPASEYKNIPLRLRVDNVMPSVSDLPRLVSSFRHPGRGRSVSIGPQSAADAYETLAYRERRRRESIGSNASRKSGGDLFDLREENGNANGSADGQGQGQGVREKSGEETAAWSSANARYQSKPRSVEEKEPFPSFPPAVAQYEKMMGQTRLDSVEPMDENALEGEGDESKDEKRPLLDGRVASEDELGEKELFSKLVKPRVRYDVEVVTKLIVYAGKSERMALHRSHLRSLTCVQASRGSLQSFCRICMSSSGWVLNISILDRLATIQ